MKPEDLFGGDMQGLMEQARLMQQQMADAEVRAQRREVAGEAGGGIVRVVMTGGFVVRQVQIEPVALTDVEMLQDLLVAATNDAIRRAKEAAQQELGPLAAMAKAAGMPGM